MSCLKISSLKVSFKRGLEHSACLCCCVSNYRAQKNVFCGVFFSGEEKTWTKLKDFKRCIDSCGCCLIVFVADYWPIRAAFRGEERPGPAQPSHSSLFLVCFIPSFPPHLLRSVPPLCSHHPPNPPSPPPPVRLFIPPLGPAVCSKSPDFSAPNREWLALISVSPPSPNPQLLLLLLLLWACFFFPSQQLYCWEPSRW